MKVQVAFKATALLGPVVFQDPSSEATQELKFTIKETVCPVEEGRPLEECDFKEDGVSDERQAEFGDLV